MKVATCTICRLENVYLVEFVEHYKSIGVDHMFIYDNNLPNTENVIDVLQSYVNDGFVTVINYQDQEKYPMGKALVSAFTDCWESNKNEYDWILFLDNDEFLMLQQDSNIKEYLNRKCFENVDIIRVNWLCYDDNNLLYYEDKPLKERFTHPCNGDPFKFNENRHIKSIIHDTAKNKEINFNKGAAHSPQLLNKGLKIVNNIGELYLEENYKTLDRNTNINYDLAYYAHYRMKTIDEYINNKIAKLTSQGYVTAYSFKFFLKYNEYSEDKKEFYNKYALNNETNVIYTIVEKDSILQEPTYITPGWNYICFTNDKKLSSSTWHIIYLDDHTFYSNILYLLIQPRTLKYLNKYVFSFYVPNTNIINDDLTEIKKNILTNYSNNNDIWIINNLIGRYINSLIYRAKSKNILKRCKELNYGLNDYEKIVQIMNEYEK